jgi:hypothetical protein
MSIPHRLRGVLALAAVAVTIAALPVVDANAADIVLTNNGFEQGLTGWRQSHGSGGVSATTERAYSGTASAKIVDGTAIGSVGLESDFETVTGGTAYGVQARVWTASGAASLYLRWYDAQGVLRGSTFSMLDAPTATWTTLRVTTTLPGDARRATALLYSGVADVGTLYFDDVWMSPKVADLGAQVVNSATRGVTFGQGGDQQHLYAVFDGNSEQAARLGVVDANTATVVATHDLPGSVNGWAATTASDGSVFLGTNNNGGLYRYAPGLGTLTSLGRAVAGESYVWTLDAGTEGKVYAGTYPTAKLVKWEPGTGFSTIDWRPSDWPEFVYLRALAYDAAQHVTYLSVGTKDPRLVRFDNSTGAVQDLLPDVFHNRGQLGNLEFTGGRLFAGGRVLSAVEQPGGSVTVTQDANIGGGRLSPAAPARGSDVYLVRDNQLIRYDLAARTVTPVGHATGFEVSRLGWVRLADQAAYPSETLIGFGTVFGEPWLFRYNPTSGRFTQVEVGGARPTTPNEIRSVATGPDGKIYSGGHLSGGVGVYTPFADDELALRPERQFVGLNQPDSILTHAGKLYFGTYTGAHVFEYDPTRPWDRDQGGTNPRELPLNLAGLEVAQNRPFALAAGDGKLFVGTVPSDGKLGGGLGVYDLAGDRVLARQVNLVRDQSITALAYHGGLLYGGTGIAGGTGVTPTQTEAKLFVYDPATAANVAEYALPVRGLSEITALLAVDGQIWGFAEGWLFVFDPVGRRFVHHGQVLNEPAYYATPRWTDARLINSPNDTAALFATIGNRQLLRIDRATKAASVLTTASPLLGLAGDRDGHLYYAVGPRLHRYLR